MLSNLLLMHATITKDEVSSTLYIYNNFYKLQVPIDNMNWSSPIYCDLFIYNMPMHKNKVRLCCYLINVLWCVLLCFQILNNLISFITPWDHVYYK
jgi:hypothetical protein